MKISMFYALQRVKQINLLQLRNSCYLDITNHIILTYQIGKEALVGYIKSLLPSRLLKNFDIPSNNQIIPFELRLGKEKWMFFAFTDLLLKINNISQTNCQKLQIITSVYTTIIILGDFNMEPSDSLLHAFMQSHNLFNLIKSDSCFKGSGSCTDLILTN